MNQFLKLKALVLMIGSAFAGTAMAAGTTDMNNNATDANAAQVTSADSSSMQQDAKTAEDVNQVLADYAGNVDVKVTQGVVYLSGELPSDTDYEKVVTLSESVKGVQDVNVDQLTVKESEKPLQDTYITAKVKGALIQADVMGKDLPSWTLGVETKNGKVYLSGTVDSEQVKQNVLKIVNSVKDVTEVEDKMTVKVSEVAPENDTNSSMDAENNSSKAM